MTQDHVKSTCFVLMPFSDIKNLPEVWEDVIRDGAFGPNKLGDRYDCRRADDVFDNQAIIKDIVREIEDSAIIIADLTTRNPNVFYELGRAHELDKECILIVQDIEDVPFDLRHLRHIRYSTTARGLRDLEEALVRTVKSIEERTSVSRQNRASESRVHRAADRLRRMHEMSKGIRNELVRVPQRLTEKFHRIAAKPDSGIARLFPRDSRNHVLDELGLNYYSFTRRRHGWERDVQVSYEVNRWQDEIRLTLRTGCGGCDYGFFLPLPVDAIPIEHSIHGILASLDDSKQKLWNYIWDYAAPNTASELLIRAEKRRVHELTLDRDGISESVELDLNNVMLLRSINWDESDRLYVIQMVAKDPDESIFLLWKTLHSFSPPTLPRRS